MLPRTGLIVLLGLLAIAGCDEPPDLAPIVPPGIETPRVPQPTAGTGSEALGETALVTQANGGLTTNIAEPTLEGETKKAGTGLTYTTLKAGTGPSVKPGDEIRVHFVGRVANGKLNSPFQSSYEQGGPITLTIGAGKVMRGWDLGIPGMKVGEKRHLVIPFDLGFGTKGFPPLVPANANLGYEVEVLEITKPYTPPAEKAEKK